MPGSDYNGEIENIRGKYYKSLGESGQIYLDHAGTTLYPSSVIERFSENLISNVYGNPHSRSPSSQLSESCVDRAKSQVLALFNADVAEYSVIFTSNSTSAVKLIGEGLSCLSDSHYVYLKDNHTSLVGLRNMADSFTMVDDIERYLLQETDDITLISWPAQSNFGGKRYPCREWLDLLAGRAKYTLIDAAAVASTSPLDLSVVKPHFMVVSFYKMFGFPDLGGLIVKNEVLEPFFSKRRYFGGGTLTALANETPFVARKPLVDGQSLEDGTLPFHSIIALSIAIEEYKRIYGSFKVISAHTTALITYLYKKLSTLTYKNGQKAVEIYGPSVDCYKDAALQGPIIAFNLKDPSGSYIGYSDFETIAASQNINIRTGTLCNSGSTSTSTGLSDLEIMTNYSNGHVCGDANDVINGKPTGAIRVSIGASSNMSDLNILINCINDFYIKSFNNVLDKAEEAHRSAHHLSHTSHTSHQTYFSRITSLTIYPIKSCSGYKITTPWTVTRAGLQWDREFCLVNRTNFSILTLKKYPQMVHLHPSIQQDKMVVKYKETEITIPLSSTSTTSTTSTTTKLCGNNILLELYNSPTITEFFSYATNMDCTLARIHNETSSNTNTTISNTSPILLISQSSVNKLSSESHEPIDPRIFRANMIVSGNPPYSEDEWSKVEIGNGTFTVSMPPAAGLYPDPLLASLVANTHTDARTLSTV